MEVEHHAGVVLLRVDHFFVIRLGEQRQEQPLHTQGRLDHIGHILLAGGLVKVFQILAAGLDVLGQVVVGTVRHAPQLAPTKGEAVLKVRGGLGVEAKLLRIVVTQPQVLRLHIERIQPVTAEAAPVIEPLQIRAGLAEELQLHLLKLAHAEDELAGGDLVTERLAYLGHAERNFLTGGALHIGKVHKNALCRLRAQIDLVLAVLGNTLEGLEHQVKLANVRKIVGAAVGAGNILFLNIVAHLFVGPAGHIGAVKSLDQIVRTVAGLASAAIHQRIGEPAQMAGGHPGLGVHQNGAVQTNIIFILLNELLAPSLFDILFQLHAQGAVVPGVGQAAVNL